jgi:hypothetical protein
MATYSASSPWHKTGFSGSDYLNHFSIRPVASNFNDVLYTVEPQYHHRPDLLAYDLYGNPKLWWVFAQRNMDTIKDPIFDLEAGVSIYLPQGPELREALGL